MTEETTTKRNKLKRYKIKQILYIDSDPSISEETLSASFSRNYNVRLMKNLSQLIIPHFLRNKQKAHPLLSATDIIITRIPPDLCHERDNSWQVRVNSGDKEAWEEEYEESLELLKQIKRLRDIPILARSGASHNALIHFMAMGVIDDYIPKGDTVEQDIRDIQCAIYHQESKYTDKESFYMGDFEDSDPGLRLIAGLRLNGGLGKYQAQAISSIARKYPFRIELHCRYHCADAKSMSQILKLQAREGDEIIIDCVEDADEMFEVAYGIQDYLLNRYWFKPNKTK